MYKNFCEKNDFQADLAWWDKQLDRPDTDERLIAFYESIREAIVTDDEYWQNKGYDIIQALVNNDARAMLIALCGWSAENLARRVFMLRCRPQYQEEEMSGTLMVEWSDGKGTETPCVIQHAEHLVCGFNYRVFERKGVTTAVIKNVYVRFRPFEDGNEYIFQCVSQAERDVAEDNEVFWYLPEE